ncbi:cation channel sperm-associated auxiliary subunit delta [Pogona vitticeps]|nr:cation channel sperm-associated protein subunit delta-like [Pogona vitticeps]
MFMWKCGSYFVLSVKFWLCSVGVNVGSWPCTNKRLVRSASSFDPLLDKVGEPLRFSHEDPLLIQHPCGKQFKRGIAPAIYLGPQVFLSLDRFESSLLPVVIPKEMTVSPALVSAAAFIQTTRVLLVVNGNIFIYFYSPWTIWKQSIGINYPVTELSNYDCCYSFIYPGCLEISSIVLAYDTGNLVEDSHIFYSLDGGYVFQPLLSRPHTDGILLGVYNFASISEIGMLLNKTEGNVTSIYFMYGDFRDMRNETGTPFELEPHDNERVQSILPPGMKGYIKFWTQDSFVSSSNNGLTTEGITIIPTDSYPNKTLPLHEDGVCFVAVSSTEIAALTRHQLFYGSLDMNSNQMVHLGKENSNDTREPCEVLMFENTGTLSIINPVRSNDSAHYHFEKCIINIQDTLMNLRPPLPSCPVEILSGEFHDHMFYIDVKQQLYFNVTFVPKPGTGAYPYVTVSNPHVLAFQAHLVQEGYTYDGNPQYILYIKLLEQQFSGMAHQDFQNDYLFGKLSSFTVDIYNKGIFCVDMHPLTALIAVDCPPKKHIRIVKTTTACSKGLFEQRLLQNLTYFIDRNVYDPLFRGRKGLAQEDLNVTYRYDLWGCPLLLYYDIPWLPLLELWDEDKFVEYVSADFVLFEINGMHNYDYLLTEVEANCLSKAQNWTIQTQDDPGVNLSGSTWTRINYESCKKPRGNKSLPSASSKYQVLNMNEKNRVLFQQYNGIYVFKVIVVDAFYSYCDLTTVFSVYVHGALPKSEINAGKTLVSFLVLIFGTILMVYYFPKLLKENARMKSVWT